ncbi:hypothetical protein [Thalassospira australica]|uniref:hypothetical protein n=1 Tax=Thalassospira australica TaxID=1528106 RepID=UPI0012E0BE51|nr:hypothetical protein [Thalassospira australica]
MTPYTIRCTDGFNITIFLDDSEKDTLPTLQVDQVMILENGGTITLQDEGEYYYKKDGKNWFFAQDVMFEALGL